MENSSPGTPPPQNSLGERLDSWKEIAAYLHRDATTVQRWEKREGMPVHRHQHDKIGSVYAFRAELDAWVFSRNQRGEQTNGGHPMSTAPPPSSHLAEITIAPKQRRWPRLLAAAGVVLVIASILWRWKADVAWRNPLADAKFQMVTDTDGTEQAAISPDGHFVAFLSDQDGQMDVWVTQIGSGQFHNLTQGRAPGIGNPSIRALGFSPDGAQVTYWARKPNGSGPNDISVWSVPTLGGQPKPYLEGVAEFDWSHDSNRLVYHTPATGDPLFVSDGTIQPGGRPIFTAAAGLHSHFPVWSPDGAFIYFVQGSLPDHLDIWRIPSTGGTRERITTHNTLVGFPVFLDRRTLMYLASDPDGSGPWLHSIDVERRIPHRLTTGPDRYTSLAASADCRHIVATLASPKTTLWRLQIGDSLAPVSPVASISLTTGTGFSPRMGPGYLLYVSATGTGESIWKLANGTSTQLWVGEAAHLLGGPAVSPDGGSIAFSVNQQDHTFLYVMHADGTAARNVSQSLKLLGAPAWAPDGKSIATAAEDHGVPYLFRIPTNGGSPTAFVKEFAIDPAWANDGSYVVYSGPDVGTTFQVKGVTAEGAAYPLPSLSLTRGARHVVFLPGGRGLVVLRGEIEHKDLWLIDLATGAERRLTTVPPEFDIRDFDIAPDGRTVVLERAQERSDVMLIEPSH